VAAPRLSQFNLIAGILMALPGLAIAQFTQAPASPFLAGAGPNSVVAADFNEDGIQDLAIADFSSNNVTVLLGDGAGNFVPATGSPIPVGTGPASLAVFTFNGHQCLAVANQGSNNVTLLQGDGSGMLTAIGSAIPAGSAPISVAASTFQGNVILAVANYGGNSITLLQGNEMSGISPAPGSPFLNGVGSYPSSVTIADVNVDGNPDLVVANKADGTVTVLLGAVTMVAGASQLSFAPAPKSPFPVLPPSSSVTAQPYPICLVAADFNGDGWPDLAIANQGTNNVSVLLGDGSGNFAPVAGSNPIGVGSAPFFVTAGYFNDDTILDLAVANQGDNTVTVLLGDGVGGFVEGAYNPFTPATGSPFMAGTTPVAIAVADFNGDGKPDLAVADKGNNSVTVLLNNFYSPVTVSAASYRAPVAAGSIVSIFGTGLATAAAEAMTLPLPVILGTTTATITYGDGTGDTLSLFYAGPTQINALIPSTAPTGQATITIFTGSASQSGSVMVTQVAPAVFSANGTGEGVAAAQFVAYPYTGVSDVFQCAGGAGTCVAIPLDVSGGNGLSQLVLYGTGIRNAAATVMVNIGGKLIWAVYAGAAPGSVGEDQVNVALPADLPSGLLPVSVVVPGNSGGTSLTSNVVTIRIQ
jgi:uncharacterized protein (TIGR03437 family)